MFTQALKHHVVTSASGIINKILHVYEEADTGILCNLVHRWHHPKCLYVTDFYAFQNIVPYITICCQEDLRQFPVVGGNLNTYLGIHDNPVSHNGGCILIWRGEIVEDPNHFETSFDGDSDVLGGSDGDSDELGGSEFEWVLLLGFDQVLK